MKIAVATDAHIYKDKLGNYWCKAIYGYSFWTRYLEVFEDVRIIARVKSINIVPNDYILVCGKGVEVFEIPFYQGPFQLLKKYISIKKKMKDAFEGCACSIFRMPSQTAQIAYKSIPRKMPFAGEIVYNPLDDVKNKNSSLIERFLSKIIAKEMRRFCLKANGVSYVTENSIQKYFPSFARRYGESTLYFESYYSTITLPLEAFSGNRDFTKKSEYVLALTDVAMNSYRKGEITLINIVKKLNEQGYNTKAVIIGDGSKRTYFENLAKTLNVDKDITFLGMLSTPEKVREELKKADIFVFPTQGEGLPRGIIEAMALGMPVLSTKVGGIPEIIDDKYLFNPNDVLGFVECLKKLFDNPIELNVISGNNFKKSQDFSNDILQSRRNEFYKKLRNLCENGE